MDIQKIVEAIKRGEGLQVEFKKRATPNITDDIAAFANTNGGMVLVGVGDQGEIVGVSEEDIRKVYDYISSIDPYPKIKAEEVYLGDKKILALEVSASHTLHTSRGIAYIRVGSRNRPLSSREIIEKAVEGAVVDVDKLPLEAGIEEMDIEKAYRYASSLGLPPNRKSLEKLGLVKDGKSTYAGVLLFSRHPEFYIPGAYIEVVIKKEGGLRKTIKGDIEKQLLAALEILETHLPALLYLSEKKHILSYPKKAVKEAVVNALIHRNYLSTAPIKIEINPEEKSVKITNPGAFPPGVSVENPIHKPRNPILCEYMLRKRYMEKLGIGIPLIKEDVKEAGWSVLIHSKPYFTEVVFLWPSLLLSGQEMKVYGAIRRGARNVTEISQKSGIAKRTVQRIIKRLIERGVVKREGKGRWVIYKIKEE